MEKQSRFRINVLANSLEEKNLTLEVFSTEHIVAVLKKVDTDLAVSDLVRHFEEMRANAYSRELALS